MPCPPGQCCTIRLLCLNYHRRLVPCVPPIPALFDAMCEMPDIIQHVVVAREGTVSTDREEFKVTSLGSPIEFVLKYKLHESETRGWFRLTDKPIVLGGALPIVSTRYDPRSDSSTFTLPTTKFASQYVLQVRQPIEVFATDGGHKSIASTRIVVTGPEHTPDELDVIPTAALGQPLFLAPDKSKQTFQLLVDPYGGQVVKGRAVAEISHADEREIIQPAVLDHEQTIPGSGRILDDGTGAVFVVTGLKPQRNYAIRLQADGDVTYKWQATTKTGPFYDAARKR